MELKNVEFYMSNTRHWHMMGNIYQDNRNKWKDGHPIVTSRIIKIDAVGADIVVHTRNSEYLIKNHKEVLSECDLKVVEEWL